MLKSMLFGRSNCQWSASVFLSFNCNYGNIDTKYVIKLLLWAYKSTKTYNSNLPQITPISLWAICRVTAVKPPGLLNYCNDGAATKDWMLEGQSMYKTAAFNCPKYFNCRNVLQHLTIQTSSAVFRNIQVIKSEFLHNCFVDLSCDAPESKQKL